jgi:hypothetical protein
MVKRVTMVLWLCGVCCCHGHTEQVGYRVAAHVTAAAAKGHTSSSVCNRAMPRLWCAMGHPPCVFAGCALPQVCVMLCTVQRKHLGPA